MKLGDLRADLHFNVDDYLAPATYNPEKGFFCPDCLTELAGRSTIYRSAQAETPFLCTNQDFCGKEWGYEDLLVCPVPVPEQEKPQGVWSPDRRRCHRLRQADDPNPPGQHIFHAWDMPAAGSKIHSLSIDMESAGQVFQDLSFSIDDFKRTFDVEVSIKDHLADIQEGAPNRAERRKQGSARFQAAQARDTVQERHIGGRGGRRARSTGPFNWGK